MGQNDNILIRKLDEFIRRYYKSMLIKGSIYSGAILLAAFVTVALIEYFGEFSSAVRAVLFFGFLSSALFVLGRYIFVPLLKLNRIGEVLSYEQAAEIVGKHFSNVQDRLLNVLQLQRNRAIAGSDELLIAGINQKIDQLKSVPFTSAIDFNENRRYLRYLWPPLAFIILLVAVWPQVLKKSTERLVNYSTFYEKEMPFNFQIVNKELKALQTQDYKLEVKIDGKELPSEVYVLVGGVEYRLEKENKNTFQYNFTNLQNTLSFQLGAADFMSREYVLEVVPRPSLLHFNLQLIYPTYLGKQNEVVENTGDLQIPQGTKVNWVFHTRNTEELRLNFMDSLALPEKNSGDQFVFSRRFMSSNAYTIKTLNSFVHEAVDSVRYSINVVPDQHPAIEVSAKADSLNPTSIYFSGMVNDDYGFSSLHFHYKKISTDSLGKTNEESGSVALPFSRDKVSQSYYHYFDAGAFNLGPGDEIDYYFEVRDNDGVNGPKSSRTQMMSFKAPTREEIRDRTKQNNSEIKKDLEESIKRARQLQKDVDELSKKINDKKQLGYEEKKKLEDLLKKQQELQNKIDEVKRENEMNNKQQNEFSQNDETILEKQKQLEQLFENVMTPEMKKLFEELNKMLSKLDKNQVQEKLDEMKLTNKDIEKELDRNLEAFKQLEFEQKFQEAIEKLEELKNKQEELSKETAGNKDEKEKDKSDPSKNSEEKGQEKNKEDKKSDPAGDNKKEDKKAKQEELGKKQEELNKQFEDLKKDLKELQQKNNALEEPNEMPSTDQKSEEITKEMQNSSQQIQQNNKKAASKSQQSAADKMDEMQQQMEQAMAEAEEKQQEENAQALRQILENLVNLSFAQEELIRELPKTRIDNPQYVAIPKQQKKLKDDSRIIEDSLLALSKRAPQISAIVNREISAINLNMDKTVKALAERNTSESTMRMQSTMTSVNNLALLLNESLEQMQQQMKKQMESKGKKGGKCKKPGSGSGQKPSGTGNSVGNMRKLQEQLNKQLREMKEALEKGQKPGDKPGDKKGEKGGQGMGQKSGSGNNMVPGSSEQFAKMAAQQEALRRQMQALMEKLKNKGNNPGGDLANLMEETEKELVNKQLTNQTMRRQQEILTKLLESEKAEKEREQDEQRKSNEAKSENFSNPGEFLEYKRMKEKEMELLNTVPPSLTPYYKEKVNKYFNNLSR